MFPKALPRVVAAARERQTEIGRLRFDDRAGTDSDVGMQDSKNDSHAIAQHVAKLRAAASERRGAEAEEETARTEETRERAKREAKKKVEAKAQAEREANKRAREDARRRAKARADQDKGQKPAPAAPGEKSVVNA